ncbi:MAG TPA: hypothetical protein VFW93_09480 [Aquabacterium sp.]|uniref:hypothetical protein n=1 Tax=Aquabacterium sp. TaxID=1872578 RepID=UPI002E330680|nr:hypothetical protein [Aquabacterium sp.]HEX5356439.1 hypothetical protein [Aquabacterium sp.]
MEQMPVTPAESDQSGQISSWRDFQDRFRAAMAMAATQAADLTLVDHDFAHWPLGERSVMEAFHQWGLLVRGTHCQMLAASYDVFANAHPRWVSWRGTWSHRVKCWLAPDEVASSLMPVFIVHGVIGLRLNEPLHGTGIWTRETGVLRTWLSEIDVNLQRSHEALPPTTLGL